MDIDIKRGRETWQNPKANLPNRRILFIIVHVFHRTSMRPMKMHAVMRMHSVAVMIILALFFFWFVGVAVMARMKVNTVMAVKTLPLPEPSYH
jgi:hypothetical protein